MDKNKFDSFTEYVNSEEYSQYLTDLKSAIVQYKTDAKDFFENLSYENKLMLFFHVVSLICQAELDDKGSYRHALYSVFGFKSDAYALGLDCGYMDLHNSIYTYDEISESVDNIFKYFKIDYDKKIKKDLIDIILYGYVSKFDFRNKQLKFDF